MLVDHGLEILTEEQCMDLVAAESVGRIAVSVSALPAIFPVNYQLVDGDVMFLTGDGMKSHAAVEGAVVGFEVDHIDAEHQTGWSVMLVGQVRLVADKDRAGFDDGRISPWVGGYQSHLVTLHPEFVSGRRIVG
jgi:nitroimidazol reductase NimA-like FMN-containing flavoprotein (pyridoxamine 5'-phosphate oxidase superfamily)